MKKVRGLADKILQILDIPATPMTKPKEESDQKDETSGS